jgi:eukaryotic-like serine/threonine-protein kinase
MAEHQQQRYRVIDRLAAGGMAEVYRAESAGLEGFKKKVAIKRVLPHLAEKKRFIQMFLDEARLGAHLSHSNCVQVFDVGVGDNTYFIVMEYVDGADLKAVIEWLRKSNRTFPVAHAVFITTKICEGLDYAHNIQDETGRPLQIVHRDLSPPNVLITKFGEIKIVDFGLAKASTQLEKSEPGIIKGKFSYLSPEAAMGQEVDARTDIFAAAIILWELLAGRKLFQGETDFETVKQVQRADVPSISRINGGVDAKLESVITRGLARDPERRFRTAREFAMALNEWLFQTGNTVSSFEIAELVQKVVRDKQSDKGKGGGVNVIDKLIEQTLFEFTSLDDPMTDGAGGRKSGGGNKRLDAGKGGAFVDIQDWGSELSDLGSSPISHDGSGAPSLEEGNLAALEEDSSPGTPLPPSPKLPKPAGTPRVQMLSSSATMPPVGLAPLPGTTNAAQAKGGATGIIAAVLLGLVVLGAAGAYYGGLIK